MKTTRKVVHSPAGSTTVTEYNSYSGGSGGRRRSNSGWGTRHGDSEPNGPSGPPMKLERKTYDEIKAQCLRDNRLFEDPDFPAVDTSIFPSKLPKRPLVWKRPIELTSDPQLFVDGACRLDIAQGRLGNCWLMAAMSCLSMYPDLLHRVVPTDQGFTAEEGYCGAFRFNFWVFGNWTEVVVDDKLPTKKGRLLYFMRSPDYNEFWASLMEKAYAKLYGSYESLISGTSSEAMEDFTGGFTEVFNFTQNIPENLYLIMTKAVKRGCLMGCSIDREDVEIEGTLPNGLVVGHAYSVTDAKTVRIQGSKGTSTIPLVRVRNPWGNETEWKGAWSDKSKEWAMISDRERKRHGLVISDDGEFWMSFKDFTENFTTLEICIGPDVVPDTVKRRFEATTYEGSWKKLLNAGGCQNYRNTFWTNPQYRVTVVHPDEGDDDNTGTLIIALLQRENRSNVAEGGQLLTIGYAVYKLTDPNCGPLDQNFFRKNKPVAKSPVFIDDRQVSGRHKLPPGIYCIIPSTFEPGEEGDFLLRIFSEKPISSSVVDEETKVAAPPPDLKDSWQPQRDLKDSWQALRDEDAKAKKRAQSMFTRTASDDVEFEIDAYELRKIFNSVYVKEFKFEGFSSETCKSLVAMKDDDCSGKLNFQECKKLWNDMHLWEAAFRKHDLDQSGSFNSYELREALRTVGMKVSNATFNSLVQRYSHRDGQICFDNYIHCVSRLCHMFDIFKEASRGTSTAQFTLDKFISSTMYS